VSTSEDVYCKFIEFEERAAGFYLRLASHFSDNPQLSWFWLDMGMQEKRHAGLLQFCLYQRLFTSDLPNTAAIQKLEGLFTQLESRAADSKLTAEDAFSLALELESSEINTIWDYLTAALHNSIYLLRRKIVTSLSDHIDGLLLAARAFGAGDHVIEELSRLTEQHSNEGP
jgi:rubrerythrin